MVKKNIIEEVVALFPVDVRIVSVAQIGDIGPDPLPAVVAAHVVGYEVEDDFQPGGVRPPHERLEFGHSIRFVVSQIGVDVVIISTPIKTSVR